MASAPPPSTCSLLNPPLHASAPRPITRAKTVAAAVHRATASHTAHRQQGSSSLCFEARSPLENSFLWVPCRSPPSLSPSFASIRRETNSYGKVSSYIILVSRRIACRSSISPCSPHTTYTNQVNQTYVYKKKKRKKKLSQGGFATHKVSTTFQRLYPLCA